MQIAADINKKLKKSQKIIVSVTSLSLLKSLMLEGIINLDKNEIITYHGENLLLEENSNGDGKISHQQ